MTERNPDEKEAKFIQDMKETGLRDGLAFECTDLNSALEFVARFREVDFCRIYFMKSMKLREISEHRVFLVEFDAESG